MSQLRQNIRNYLYPMTVEEVKTELALAEDRGDFVATVHILEFLKEIEKEENKDI